MPRRYTSFLVRCWNLERGRRRIEIEHVQSGAHGKLASMEAAFAWMEARMTEGAPKKPDVDMDIERVEPAAPVPGVKTEVEG